MPAKIKNELIVSIDKEFNLSRNEIRKIIKDFQLDMKRGLAGNPSSLKMIPTYCFKPTGTESGKFLALDLGGTNFRILEVELLGRGEIVLKKETKFVLGEKYITGTAQALFDFIAECVKQFSKAQAIAAHEKRNIGFTFSFPVKQTGIAAGVLLHWTKDFSAKGVVGKDVVKLLNQALSRKGLDNIRIAALVNDTVGTLVARAYQNKACDIGVILGTGTNACYEEETRAGMIINIEWGNFNKLRLNAYDRLLDKMSENPMQQRLEKMVSGMYLGEITRLVIKDLIKRKMLFEGKSFPVFDKAKNFKSEYMSKIEADCSKGLSGIEVFLKASGIRESALEERKIIKNISQVVSKRGARISAAAIAAVVKRKDPRLLKKHTIAVDGSVYQKHPHFATNIKSTLKEIFGAKASRINLVLTKDGSGRGAAITAATALIMFFLAVSISSAAPCYGTSLPQKHKLSVGLESYTLFKRYLEDTIGTMRSQQQFYAMSFGVFDWFSIDSKAGTGNIKQCPQTKDKINYSTGFAGGYGLRLKFFDKNNMKAVLGFQHISVHPKSKHLGSVKNRAILDDWQWSILGSYSFKRITPYVGTRWSRVDYIHWVADQRKRWMSDFSKSVGLIYGLDFFLTKNICLNLEGSSFDSDALACRLSYDF